MNIPGMGELRCLPSPNGDIFTSNAFVLDAGDYLLVIDPGSGQRRVDELMRAIRPADSTRPVFICLTHCHWDHVAGAQALKERCGNACLIAHVDAVQPMRDGDAMATAAFLYQEQCPPTLVDIAILGNDIPTPPLAALRLERGSLEDTGEWRLLYNGKLAAVFYPMPGHTPDGMAVGVGDCLFCGDIFFAAWPGIAGVPGWDREALLRSLERLRGLFATGAYRFVHGGHGDMLTVDAARKVLEKMRGSIGRLGEIAALDGARADFLSEYAKALLREVERLFGVLTVKMHRVSAQLERLEEAHLADTLLASMDFAAVESVFEQFQAFLHETAGDGIRIRTALKAVALIKKIRHVFLDNPWPGRVDADLVRRINNLFAWFMDTIQGCECDGSAALHNLPEFVDAVIKSIDTRASVARNYLADDDGRSFEDNLIAALGINRGLFAACRITCHDLSGGQALADFDAHRLGDALSSIFEILAAMPATRIDVSISMPGPRLVITTGDDLIGRAFRSDQSAFFRLTMRGHGAQVIFDDKITVAFT